MTDKQPEALRFAELLNGHEYCNFPQMDEAAEELRRQHQEIQELKKAEEELLGVLQTIAENPPIGPKGTLGRYNNNARMYRSVKLASDIITKYED